MHHLCIHRQGEAYQVGSPSNQVRISWICKSTQELYRLVDYESGKLFECRSVKFTEDFVPANDKRVTFDDQVVTVPLQDHPCDDTEEDEVDMAQSTLVPPAQVPHDTVGAPTLDSEKRATTQISPDEVSAADRGESISSNEESSDSEAEPVNPTGLEAISEGHHQVLSVDAMNDIPQSFADIEAINNGTWVLTELPTGRKALACKWLWRNKFDAVGHFTKYKARLVIKGFMQRYGLDYVEIFAPVLRYNTLRLVLFLVASNGWIIRQMGVKTAFLSGYLDEDTEICMMQPPNFAVPGMEHLVCKLPKGIYGWNEFSLPY
ncbi:Aste57867_12542 [Aphanomyces stellatus]|uniref:Aste57867_12542 protein n=1 Tax=Aphanomyces stellatus TaxID=120398 RepID=A0A485KW79_9STRA|nr:hypothetical protein As57867_012496 [Aphanomyces stellatus]VFT89393.1 Aste57867_12542 [Aphanomyces stellatus]